MIEVLNAVTSLLGVLLWPALLLTVVLIFRPQLRRLLGGVEEIALTTPGGIEASARFKVEAAVAAATAVKAAEEDVDPRLVLLEAQAAANSVPEKYYSSPDGSTTFDVLWVDDNPGNNVYERAALEALGARFTLKKDTDAARDELERSRFDVVISDMSRPSSGTAGYDLLATLRSRRDPTPLVFYVGSEPQEYVAMARERGAFGLTSRPGRLVELVIHAVGGRRSNGA